MRFIAGSSTLHDVFGRGGDEVHRLRHALAAEWPGEAVRENPSATGLVAGVRELVLGRRGRGDRVDVEGVAPEDPLAGAVGEGSDGASPSADVVSPTLGIM